MKIISFMPQAYKDYLEWLSADKKIFLKITSLIKEISRNPEAGAGKPERLKLSLPAYGQGASTRSIAWFIRLLMIP